MYRLGKIQTVYIVAIASAILGILIGFILIWECSKRININDFSQENFQLTALFRNERLIVSITNLGSDEIVVQMIFLEGRNYIDFDMPINAVLKPKETIELQTSIMQPAEKGTYTIKVKLSNGQIIDYKITNDD